VDETAAWVEHAMQLPRDVVEAFKDNGVIGEDFRELLANDGALLSSRMGINKLVKKRVVRGMKLKIMGLGEVPRPPTMATASAKGCGKLLVKWDLSDDAGAFPVHRILLQRLASAHDGTLLCRAHS